MRNFDKKIVITMFLFFLFNVVAFGEIVNEFQIKGNDRVSKESIKMFSNVNVGDDITKNDLNKILKNIYDTNFFENVKVSLENNILSIFVKENPVVENVSIKGLKSKTLTKELEKPLKVKSRSSYNEFLLNEDRKNILNVLKNKGYFFSKVDLMVEKLSDNKVNLVYQVEIGDKAKIKKISFIGDKVFKDRKLRSVIVSEEYKF